MSQIAFLLNGDPVCLTDPEPTVTLLDWLRDERGLKGTKEGCNEGDCGACTVMVTDADGARAFNACILFLPQLHGKAVRTVEGIAGPDGALHPVQQAMVEHHGSQCGFCTPGFVVSMAVAHLNGRRDFNDQLAGNLCRCTGYAPIVRAAEAAADAAVPDWMRDDLSELEGTVGSIPPYIPETADDLAEWYAAHPDAVLVGGATDVGLWVTKGLRELPEVAFVAGIADLKGIEIGADRVRIGASASLTDVGAAMADLHPDFAELIRRYGSVQVRTPPQLAAILPTARPSATARRR